LLLLQYLCHTVILESTTYAMKLTTIFSYSFLLGMLPCLVQGKRILLEDYSGPQFFSKMDFFSGPDPTQGHVQYLDISTANSTGLAGLFPSMHSNQTIYLGTDYQNPAPSGRPSVRVSSNRTYDSGLFIADITHMPGGVCGAWPAYWLLGTAAPWPQAGEVDIIEGINQNTDNSMALHVYGDFTVEDNTSAMSGTLQSLNADVNAANQPHNKGAVAVAPNGTKTFGASFNDNMGGIYATEVNPSAKRISIWFFPRGSIPDNVMSEDPQPSTWGTPLANFAGRDLDFSSKFKNLQIIINLTYCGEWAGKPSVWGVSECAKLADTCDAYVSDNPRAFEDMYWAINSLKVFDVDNATLPAAMSTPSNNSSSAVASIQTSPPVPLDSTSASTNPYAIPTSAPSGESIPRVPYPNDGRPITTTSATITTSTESEHCFSPHGDHGQHHHNCSFATNTAYPHHPSGSFRTITTTQPSQPSYVRRHDGEEDRNDNITPDSAATAIASSILPCPRCNAPLSSTNPHSCTGGSPHASGHGRGQARPSGFRTVTGRPSATAGAVEARRQARQDGYGQGVARPSGAAIGGGRDGHRPSSGVARPSGDGGFGSDGFGGLPAAGGGSGGGSARLGGYRSDRQSGNGQQERPQWLPG
jgi:hypothetical protein